jgi:hypothetical protein
MVKCSIDFADSCVALHMRPLLKFPLQSPKVPIAENAINLPTNMIGPGLALCAVDAIVIGPLR